MKHLVGVDLANGDSVTVTVTYDEDDGKYDITSVVVSPITDAAEPEWKFGDVLERVITGSYCMFLVERATPEAGLRQIDIIDLASGRIATLPSHLFARVVE